MITPTPQVRVLMLTMLRSFIVPACGSLAARCGPFYYAKDPTQCEH